jgi:prepilin-type N-terminal cleavage/methylation domain-containing protein
VSVLSRLHADQRGFTLIEVLSAMAVFGIVLATFAMVMRTAIRHSGEVEQQSNLQNEARYAITGMSQDLRQVYDGDSNLTTSPIQSIFANQITFLSPDRQQPFHLRRITYRLQGTELQRATLTSTDTDGYPWAGISAAPSAFRPLVRNVVNSGTQPVFRYLDDSGAVTAVPANISTIELQVVVATKTSPSQKYTYKSSVTVRGES